jgi:hypothetical protein
LALDAWIGASREKVCARLFVADVPNRLKYQALAAMLSEHDDQRKRGRLENLRLPDSDVIDPCRT